MNDVLRYDCNACVSVGLDLILENSLQNSNEMSIYVVCMTTAWKTHVFI